MKNFSFGHTIVPEELQPSQESSNLQDLFKIGQKKIKIDVLSKQLDSDDQSSDRTVKNKSIKKEKKGKKGKKGKKEKSKKKDRKKAIKIEDDSSNEVNYVLQVYNKKKEIDIPEKYQKILYKKTLEQELNSQFAVNIKLAQGLLNIDIIKFPQENLYKYGLMDKQVPRYKRFQNFNQIIGIKKAKRSKQMIKQLNKTLNQKIKNEYQEQINKNRYYNYIGYEQCGEKISHKQNIYHGSNLIKFNANNNSQNYLEDQYMKINKEFNRKINENRNNIQIWLQFIKAQDNLSDSLGTKNGVLQRKISIIQRGLQSNPFNQQLSILYLRMLFKKDNNHKLIATKCSQFIKQHPDYIPFWKLYFNLHLQKFSTFSHSYIRNIFEEINDMYKKIIDKTKSAIEIWKIRKCSLEILRNVLVVYKMEGYGQLASALISALVEFNIFMPEDAIKMIKIQDKLQAFKKYWEDYDSFKLGEIEHSNWGNIISSQQNQQSFIGQYGSFKGKTYQNTILREIQETNYAWRPSNALKDSAIIENNPESFILYEDIDFAMILYRDSESLLVLVDILANHLEMPNVFTTTNIHHQFVFKFIEKELLKIIKDNKINKQTDLKESFFWAKYWNPMKTQDILPAENIIKLQYFRRILTNLKQKMLPYKSKINEYLFFINCCFYLNPSLQLKLRISSQTCQHEQRGIISQQSSNLSIWSMYIETMYIKDKDREECLKCYLSLFQTSKLSMTDLHDLQKYYYQILFWLWSFSHNNQIDIRSQILKLYYEFLIKFNNNSKRQLVISLTDKISKFQCIFLQEQLSKHIEKIMQDPQCKEISLIYHYRYVFFYFCYIEEFKTSKLVSQKGRIKEFIIREMLKMQDSSKAYFLLWFLVNYRLLTMEHIITHSLLEKMPYLILIKYWISINKKPFILFQSQFDSFTYKNISLWLIAMTFYLKKKGKIQNLNELFLNYGKKISFEDELQGDYCQYIVLLNKLLLYDGDEHNKKFIVNSLNHLPFSKQLYLLNVVVSQQSERKKLLALIYQKNVRILNQDILT